MKHVAMKVKNTEKVSSNAKGVSVKIDRKISNPNAIKLVKDNEEKTEKKMIFSASSDKKPKRKSAEAVVAFPLSENKTTKAAAVISEKIVVPEKDALLILSKQAKSEKSALNVSAQSKTAVVKSKISQRTLERQSVSVPIEKSISKNKSLAKTAPTINSDVELKNKNQKTNSIADGVKLESKKEKNVPVVAAQKVQRREKNAKILPSVKVETAKKKSFVAINKISVIKKQPSLSDENVNKKLPKTDLILPLNSPETISIEAESAVKSAAQKSKPKNKKPIGAAIFRGKKARYDFQVYSIDAEFGNVSAIYVISKRKLDKQKRGHHALVCIGQTDSISSEISKHKNKCIKKHNANVISILPEVNEKKRLKIEEDLKAAHIIACGI